MSVVFTSVPCIFTNVTWKCDKPYITFSIFLYFISNIVHSFSFENSKPRTHTRVQTIICITWKFASIQFLSDNFALKENILLFTIRYDRHLCLQHNNTASSCENSTFLTYSWFAHVKNGRHYSYIRPFFRYLDNSFFLFYIKRWENASEVKFNVSL